MNCKTCAGPCCLKGSNHEGDCEGYTPMSHYDQIRSMSVEEMAEFIGKVTAGGYGMCAPGHSDCAGKDSCAPCWLDWLKSEAEEDE